MKMNKAEVFKKILDEKIVAVIRTSTKEKAMLSIDTCVSAGFKIIELTFTIPNVELAIKEAILKYRNKGILIGVGTVLIEEQAMIACKLEADFVVAPNTNMNISEICNDFNILYIPGVMTINEIINAMDLGCELVKLFPANNYNPSFISSIHAPIPNIKIMVTGGINQKNIKEWLEVGASVCGIGGNLIEPIEKNNDVKKGLEIAKMYIEAIK